MLKKVRISRKIKIKNFLKFVSVNQKKQFASLSKFFQGKKIVHINATGIGGGVAEILQNFIPYSRALGIKSNWYVIDAKKVNKKFFSFTNKLHNALQGMSIDFSTEDWESYETVNKKIAKKIENIDYDVLVIHDPQLLFSINFLKDKKPKIYVNHIDTSAPFKPVWKKILPVIKKYDRIIFSNKDFINNSLVKNKIEIFPPAIDPLALKQKIVSKSKARAYLKKYGIPEKGPLIVQISRFDVWKNPMGVIEAFRILQKNYSKAHLALVGFDETKDNPEAEAVYRDIARVAKTLSNVFLFFRPEKINIPEFTMMTQNSADVVVQNSIKEGFGLVVTEAMWKEKTIVGGPASGIRKQIVHGKNGFITENPEGLAKCIINLLEHPEKRKRMGKAAKASVAKNFLLPRLLLDHLKLYKSVLKN